MENNEKVRSVGKARRQAMVYHRLKKVLRVLGANEAEIDDMAYELLEESCIQLKLIHFDS